MRRMRADLAFLLAVDRSRVRATRCFGEKQDITRGVQDTFHSTPIRGEKALQPATLAVSPTRVKQTNEFHVAPNWVPGGLILGNH